MISGVDLIRSVLGMDSFAKFECQIVDEHLLEADKEIVETL